VAQTASAYSNVGFLNRSFVVYFVELFIAGVQRENKIQALTMVLSECEYVSYSVGATQPPRPTIG